MWYHRIIGKRSVQLSITWWQTETGGIMITAAAGRDADQARHRYETFSRG